ncbi:MAG: hypothetical protein ACK4SJ_04775 [Sphingorhabdus sp.]
MSGSDWGQFSKTGLKRSVVVASLFVVLLTGVGASVQLGYYQQAADQATKHQRWAKNEIRAGCPSFDNLSKAQCAYQAKQSAEEDERAEYDLYAQRTSALWAAIMAFAALLGIGLSGVGVYLVWTTFRETKRSADVAKDNLDFLKTTNDEQFRPFVYVCEAKYIDVPISETLDIFDRGKILISFKNFGHLLAHEVEIEIDVLGPDFEGDGGRLVLAEEYFGTDYFPPGRERAHYIEFKWPTGARSTMRKHHDLIALDFKISYAFDTHVGRKEIELSASLVAPMDGESAEVVFIPPKLGWHYN